MDICYKTDMGALYHGLAEDILRSSEFEQFKNKINLIFTSPPFPLNRKKKYGNLTGETYLTWLSEFSTIFKNLLTEDGSIVLEIGNNWIKGLPAMSTLPLKCLISFQEKSDLYLCQQFINYNPSRLPSPIQWVNINRVRVKDSYTHIWWFSKTTNPKANNRNVLNPYSKSMTKLLETGTYNSGKRPSEFNIGSTSFSKDNGGAIPSNVLIASNTHSVDAYLSFCKKNNIIPHPARMPKSIVEFFVKLLTDKGDIVLDPFAGSNTTGEVAESLHRKWVSIEPNENYNFSSKARFFSESI